MAKLTDTKIKTSKNTTGKNIALADGNGLQLLIKPNGSRIWEIRFTLDGKQSKTTLGSYPNVSLKDAREKAISFKQNLQNGINPIEEKRKQKEINKNLEIQKKFDAQCFFETISYEWLEYDNLQQNLTQRYGRRKETIFENFIIPFFKNRNINEITSSEVEKLLHLKAETANDTAHKIYLMLVKLFNYAIYKKYATKNIMLEIPKEYTLKPRKKEHFKKITDEKILSELLNAIDNYSGWDSVKVALQLVAMLPLRASNLCNLQWSQIDFDKRLITIPRSEMKIKDINLDDFKIPLPIQATQLLETHKLKFGTYEYVFINQDLKAPINQETPNRALIRLGFNDDKHQRLHSFRGTYRSLVETYQAQHQASFETKERVLDHHEKSLVVRAYAHKANFTDQMRDLLQWWADFLDNVKL